MHCIIKKKPVISGVDSEDAGGARAPLSWNLGVQKRVQKEKQTLYVCFNNRTP